MSTPIPLGFHPLPAQVKHVVLSSGNEIKRRASRASSQNYGMNISQDVSFVYSNRPVEVGETVYLRFGPDMRHNFSIGFYVHVGFTKKDPKTLRCSVTSTDIPGYFLSKIYTSNTSKLSFTLDPSGIIDFEGPRIGNDPRKSLELGEITGPYWAVISVPEHPFYVEILPPPPDAKPIVRKVTEKPQSVAENPVNNSKSDNEQVNSSKSNNGQVVLVNLEEDVQEIKSPPEIPPTNIAVLEVSQPSENSTVVSLPSANIPVNSSQRDTFPVNSSSSHNNVTVVVENHTDDNSIHISTESSEYSHQQNQVNTEEYSQNHLDVETLIKEAAEQTDRQTNRRYKIIFSVVTLSVVAVTFILYFTLIR